MQRRVAHTRPASSVAKIIRPWNALKTTISLWNTFFAQELIQLFIKDVHTTAQENTTSLYSRVNFSCSAPKSRRCHSRTIICRGHTSPTVNWTTEGYKKKIPNNLKSIITIITLLSEVLGEIYLNQTILTR